MPRLLTRLLSLIAPQGKLCCRLTNLIKLDMRLKDWAEVRIPSSVQDLCVSGPFGEPYGDIDTLAAALLTAAPQLRRLKICGIFSCRFKLLDLTGASFVQLRWWMTDTLPCVSPHMWFLVLPASIHVLRSPSLIVFTIVIFRTTHWANN